MKLIYVTSPYHGEVENNCQFAKRACLYTAKQGHAFFAPHLLYPEILDDNDPAERQQGLEMGLVVLSRCDELWCFGPVISAGMQMELLEAERLCLPMRHIVSVEEAPGLELSL